MLLPSHGRPSNSDYEELYDRLVRSPGQPVGVKVRADGFKRTVHRLRNAMIYRFGPGVVKSTQDDHRQIVWFRLTDAWNGTRVD